MVDLPGNTFDALFQQARQALSSGQLDSAREFAEAAIARKPSSFDGNMLMADICGRAGRTMDEILWIEKALARKPKHPPARLHLARRQLRAGELRSATRNFESVVRADRSASIAAQAAAGMATALEAQGKAERAARAIKDYVRGPGLETIPEVAAVHVRLTMAQRGADPGAEDRAREFAEGWLGTWESAGRGSGGPPSTMFAVRNLRFSLARLREDQGDFDAAFAAASAANATATGPAGASPTDASQSFDRDNFARVVDRQIAWGTPEQVGALAGPLAPSGLPVFLIGMPRCGSTLLDRMIDMHPQAAGAGELGTVDIIGSDVRALLGGPLPDALASMTSEQAQQIQDDYAGFIARVAAERSGRRRLDDSIARVTNKELFNHMHLPVIAATMPTAPIIHCTRNAADLAISCFMSPLPTDSCPFASDLDDIAARIAGYQRLVAHFRHLIPNRWLDVAYEDLVTDHEGVARRVLDFLELPWDDAVLRHHESKRVETTVSHQQVRKPLYATSVGRAERFAAHLSSAVRGLGQS